MRANRPGAEPDGHADQEITKKESLRKRLRQGVLS